MNGTLIHACGVDHSANCRVVYDSRIELGPIIFVDWIHVRPETLGFDGILATGATPIRCDSAPLPKDAVAQTFWFSGWLAPWQLSVVSPTSFSRFPDRDQPHTRMQWVERRACTTVVLSLYLLLLSLFPLLFLSFSPSKK